MNEKDEKALIALLATIMHPDAQRELTRQEIDALINETAKIDKMERDIFESIDPISLIKDLAVEDKIISFPEWKAAEELPSAVGFYRSGNEMNDDQETRESVRKKREVIRQQLKKKQKDSDVDIRND